MLNRAIISFLIAHLTAGMAVSAFGEERVVEPTKTLLVDADVWAPFNWASFDQDKIASYGNHQYTTYWDADQVLVVARRDLRSDEVQTLRLEGHTLTINANDGHRNAVLGVSPADGRLHLSWDHHGNDLRYTKTRAAFLSDPPLTMSRRDFEPAQGLAPGAPQRVTYPRFLNDAEDRLYLVYRSGGSGNGRTIVARYDADEGNWHVSAGRLFGSGGTYEPWEGSTSRNAYLHGILFDGNNRLHVTWLYRETGRSWASNHDLCYAYSDDFGVTWMNNDGLGIANLAQDDAIVIDDPGIVVQEIPVYSWVMNQCAMALDSKNQPHVALYRLPGTFKPTELKHDPPDVVREGLRFFHYWRDAGGNWHDSGPLDLPEGLAIKRPNIVIGSDDTAIIYWASNRGFRCYAASSSDSWKNWEMLSLTGPELTSNDAPKHDRQLLMEKEVLSFTADPNGDTRGVGYAILDFNLEDFKTVTQEVRE